MSISWSADAPDSALEEGGETAFFLVTGMSQKGYDMEGAAPGFKVLVNGNPEFSFQNQLGGQWSVNGVHGGSFSFETFQVDQAGDLFGFSRIIVPNSLIKSQKKVDFKIIGDPSGSQHWFMIFMCHDGLKQFRNKAETEFWYRIIARENGAGTLLEVEIPGSEKSGEITLSDGSGKLYKSNLKIVDNKLIASFNLNWKFKDLTSQSCTIGTQKRILVSSQALGKTGSESEIGGDYIRMINSAFVDPKTWETVGEFHASNVSSELDRISSSVISGGDIHILVSSHQDIAWMDSPEECTKDRDELLITPAIRQLRENPGYINDMEDILMLREYLERHPESKEEIHQLGLAGKLFWGASYIQPYEEMYSGESLVRQFYLGKKWFEKEFPGCKSEIYWNFDVPGRTLQMPQILAKSGVNYMLISRHDLGMFYWAAPDGSKVLTYSPGHYYNDYVQLKQGFFKTVGHIANLSEQWGKFYDKPGAKPVMPVLSDADMALPDMYFDYIKNWKALSSNKDKEGKQRQLPDMFHSSAINFMKAAESSGANIKTIRGERPAVWLYIHGPSHYEALRYGRSASRTLPAAEKMATIRSLLDGNWNHYPTDRLTLAWEKAIYPDHGWGGNKGTITDSTFLAKFYQADTAARNMIREAASGIASRIGFKPEGVPVVVFNSFSWTRTSPVSFEIELPDEKFKNLTIKNSQGQEVPSQVAGKPEFYPSGYLKKINLLFIAKEIPSLGYATFYAVGRKGRVAMAQKSAVPAGEISTDFFNIRFSEGGMSYLFDKDLQKEIWKTDQFAGGELFTLQSIGNGAGEFSDVQQPDTSGFERMKGRSETWKIVEDGPVRMVVRSAGTMKHNRVEMEWIIYKTIRRIDVRADLIDWDGTAYREFRLAFPANMQQPELTYEVPFGAVTVGKDELPGAAGERYVTPCKEVHPRGINNWFSANDGTFGITISSSVAVWDYVNMTHLPTSATLLQPVLLASRQSCHGLGPLYHQRGSHSMDFSIFLHKPGWINGYRDALEANEPLTVIVGPSGGSGSLPEVKSFLSLTAPDVIVSTLKKEDSGTGVVIRLYDAKGENQEVDVLNQLIQGKVFTTNLIEENPIKLSDHSDHIKLRLGHHSIETLLIRRDH